MNHTTHPLMESFGRALDRGSGDVVGALFAIGGMLDDRLQEIRAAQTGEPLVHIHEETTETTLAIIESGDNPQLATHELEDGSIALTVLRAEDGKPAAQIRLTKLRALELGLHFIDELACKQCRGTGLMGGTWRTATPPCPRCGGAKLDTDA